MTRIAEIKTHPVSVPRPEPVWTAHEELKAWSVILTEVKTDDGLVGYYRPGMPNSVYAEELVRFLDLGYRAVKLKTGAEDVIAGVERVGAVRAAIGDKPELMLDMNAPYDLPDCIEFARRVEPHRIF